MVHRSIPLFGVNHRDQFQPGQCGNIWEELDDQIEFLFSFGTDMINNLYFNHEKIPTGQR